MNRRAVVVAGALLAGLSAVAAKGAEAAGDPAAGEDVFIKCSGCHQVGPGAESSIGPQLNGVVGRKAGSVPDYDYSEAVKNSGLIFDEAKLHEFVRNPKGTIPGTKMNYAGLKQDKDASDLIAYLRQFGRDGKPK